MRRLDLLTGVFILVFSALIMYESGTNMTMFAQFAPGPGFFPFWLGAIMAGLALLLIVDTLRRPAQHEGPFPFPARQAAMVVAAGLLSMGLYAFLLEIVGYVVDTFVVIWILLGVIEKEDWKHTLAVAVLMTLAFYLIFQVWLGIRLPKNMFGF